MEEIKKTDKKNKKSTKSLKQDNIKDTKNYKRKSSHSASFNNKHEGNNLDYKSAIEAKVDAFFNFHKEYGIRKLVSPSKLIEANANIGCYTKYWNPKMKPYIYNKKSGRNHIIDLLKCLVFLDRACKFLADLSKEGGRILFVGTRNDFVKNLVAEEVKRIKQFYINKRWLGGTLTNFRIINRSIIKLNNLLILSLSGEIKKYTKKEQMQKTKEINRLSKFLYGIRTMKSLPQAVVVLDPIVEHNAIEEAKKMHIPVVALANTNADPTNIDFIIPCNTNSYKTVWLITKILVDSIAEAFNQPTTIIGKKDSEIELPEFTKATQDSSIITRTTFTKASKKIEEVPSDSTTSTTSNQTI